MVISTAWFYIRSLSRLILERVVRRKINGASSKIPTEYVLRKSKKRLYTGQSRLGQQTMPVVLQAYTIPKESIKNAFGNIIQHARIFLKKAISCIRNVDNL